MKKITIFGLTKEVYIEQKKRLEKQLKEPHISKEKRMRILSTLYSINGILKEFEKRR